jgi:hypothetical protein
MTTDWEDFMAEYWRDDGSLSSLRLPSSRIKEEEGGGGRDNDDYKEDTPSLLALASLGQLPKINDERR